MKTEDPSPGAGEVQRSQFDAIRHSSLSGGCKETRFTICSPELKVLSPEAAGLWRCLPMTFSLTTPWGSWEELRSELQCQDAVSVSAGVLLPSWVLSQPSCSTTGCAGWKLLSPIWKTVHGLAS